MSNEVIERFIKHLPEKVQSTDDFEYGIKYRKKEKALNYIYIGLNHLYRKYIVIDIDKPQSAFLWEEKKLPPPSIITINPKNTHCHYLWEIKTPVIYTENGRVKPQQYFENTDLALTTILNADKGYTGYITKNPIHNTWKIITHHTSYEIEDFGEYIDVFSHKKQRKCKSIAESGEGRNVTLFNILREWAYVRVKQHLIYEHYFKEVEEKDEEDDDKNEID